MHVLSVQIHQATFPDISVILRGGILHMNQNIYHTNEETIAKVIKYNLQIEIYKISETKTTD